MFALGKRFWQDERGFIVSAELVLIVTIGVLGMIVGLSSVSSAINNELNDISNAFGTIDQSFWYSGMVNLHHAGVPGSAFADRQDFCDCTTIVPVAPAAKAQYSAPHSAPPMAVPPPPPAPFCPVPDEDLHPPHPPHPAPCPTPDCLPSPKRLPPPKPSPEKTLPKKHKGPQLKRFPTPNKPLPPRKKRSRKSNGHKAS